MPKLSELPEEIRDFAYRQAAQIDTGVDFRSHMERLAKSMEQLAKHAEATGTPQDDLLKEDQLEDPIEVAPGVIDVVRSSDIGRYTALKVAMLILFVGSVSFALASWTGTLRSQNKDANRNGPAVGVSQIEKSMPPTITSQSVSPAPPVALSSTSYLATLLFGSWCDGATKPARMTFDIRAGGTSVVAVTTTPIGELTIPVKLDSPYVILDSGDGRYYAKFYLADSKLEGRIAIMGANRTALLNRC